MKTQTHTMHLKASGVGRQIGLTLMLIAAGLVLSLTTFARGSQLEISLWNGADFELEVCGERYHGDGTLILDDLPAGMSRVRIIQRQQNSCGTSGNASLLYNGFINIPGRSKVIACVRPNRQVRIVDIMRLRPQQQGCQGTRPFEQGHRDRPQAHYDQNAGFNEGYGHTDYDDYGHEGHGHGYGQGHGSGGFDMQEDIALGGGTHGQTGIPADVFGNRLTHGEMNRLLEDLADASFESDRFVLAQQRLRHREATSHQIKRIMDSFWFEDTKLRFAKFAYERSTDPQNYWVVNDAFDYQNSIHELDNFIQFNG